MQVMVGLPFNHTPVFSDTDMAPRIKSLLASAHDIAVEDLLPHVKRDPSYLAQKEMQVFQDWGLEAREVYPDTVN
jgi:murein L,D-transpeptidase YcbB/YkuD